MQVAKYASDFLYDWLLRNKIHIFEYQKSMVHGKVAIVDDMWSTIGSYNQNHLSAYLSIELNLDIVSTPFATGFNEHLLKLMKDDCEEITNEKFIRKTTILIQFRRWLSYQLLRLSLRILLLINRIFYFND